MHFSITTISVIATALVVGCGPVNTAPGSDVAPTWEQARVYLPQNSSYLRPAAVLAQGPHPTVLYLHGCTGITAGDQHWAATLAGAGYAVVMTDSFARSYRRRNCDPVRNSIGLFPEAQRMRQEEISHALEMLQSSPWADRNNLFLMGHSEGGAAVSRSRGDGFKAMIISGDACRSGLRAPFEMPILVINFQSDPWSSGLRVSCRNDFPGRGNASELLLEGGGHDTSDSSEAQKTVLKFLSAQTNR